MSATKVPVHINPVIPNIRIFRQLDTALLSDEFMEKIGLEEGDYEFVDAERPRDLPWTEEIMEATIGAVLVDSEGEVLAEFSGETAVARAERAKASAKVTFEMELDTDDEDGDPELGL